jgi:protein-S-isoprenylcysteine O-methyltransferase Ste14
VLAAALFGLARTWAYWQAWLFLAVFGLAAGAITVDLARHDPALLARRVQAGPTAEKAPLQRVIQSFASLAFLGLFAVSALDRHAGWSRVPVAVVLAGDGLVAAGLFVVFRVFRVNTFTSATIEVERDQQVVATGPYAVVRHPMYAGALVMLLGVPLALGSWWALVAVPVMTGVIVWRLLDEERQLARDLRGYDAYLARVRHRLVPGVW